MSIKKINTLIDKYTLESANDISDGNDLAAEVGHLCSIIRKERLRNENEDIQKKIDLEIEATKPIKEQLKEEAGDILFILFRILKRNDITLEEVVDDQEHKLRGKSISLERKYKK